MTNFDTNDLRDIIHANVIKAHALTLALHAAIGHSSPLANEYLANAAWAIGCLLGDAEDAQKELSRIRMEGRDTTVETKLPAVTSGM